MVAVDSCLLGRSSHACQALADLKTIRERLGRREDVRVVYPGDGNNVCHSLMVACTRPGADFVAATTPGYEPDPRIVEVARRDGSVGLVHDPRDALLAPLVG